jgi:hypothetical protein
MGIKVQSYSSRINQAITDYDASIAPLVRAYEDIEGAKGNWHAQAETYRDSKLFSEKSVLDQAITNEVQRYEEFQQALEKVKGLYSRFETLLTDCRNGPGISEIDYTRFTSFGYNVTPAKEQEEILPKICEQLDTVLARIKIIRDQIDERLPLAANNLDAFCYRVELLQGTATAKEIASNYFSPVFLQKAIDARKSNETATIKEAKSSISFPFLSGSSETDPAKELTALNKALISVTKLAAKNPLQKDSKPMPMPMSVRVAS